MSAILERMGSLIEGAVFPAPNGLASMKFSPLLTLIADDSDDNRVLFARAVRSIPGLGVAGLTRDGVDTLAYLNGIPPYGNRAQFPYPDLILLDYQMPGYNGLEVLASMRPVTRRPKIILWSDAIDAIDQALAYELGADFVCSKPILSQEMRTLLHRMRKDLATGSIPSPALAVPAIHFAQMDASVNETRSL